MVLLTIFALSIAGEATAAEPGEGEPRIHAPQLRPWPDGLPDPVGLPDGSVMLVPALADAVHLRLLECSTLPGLAELALEESDRVCRVVIAGALAAQSARLAAEQLGLVADYEDRWPRWAVFLAIAATAVVAAGLGMVAGWVAGTVH